MGNTVVNVKNISVVYITGDLRNIGLKEYIVKNLTKTYKANKFIALQGISFTLNQGDLLGIIGANGAGKSTLLKVITQIMRPSSGSVQVNGKVAALLELASGFDSDLNLKENAYLRGAMLGYTREFMDKKYPEILDFSELREFESRPFKQLSSGMKSRIAFSIASMVEPEILILDEVLSVGDGAFKEKSEAKMKEIIANGKATILVSHSIQQIRRLCNKVLWLDKGKQIALGDTESVCDAYEEFLKTGKLPLTGNE
ncbi:MAG: ABC transporter ATP-binding protein [Ruminiclostridium sp.]|nr:ABC transporter ATP-binding protein [Ruminiclostridium sp.]